MHVSDKPYYRLLISILKPACYSSVYTWTSTVVQVLRSVEGNSRLFAYECRKSAMRNLARIPCKYSVVLILHLFFIFISFIHLFIKYSFLLIILWIDITASGNERIYYGHERIIQLKLRLIGLRLNVNVALLVALLADSRVRREAFCTWCLMLLDDLDTGYRWCDVKWFVVVANSHACQKWWNLFSIICQ